MIVFRLKFGKVTESEFGDPSGNSINKNKKRIFVQSDIFETIEILANFRSLVLAICDKKG